MTLRVLLWLAGVSIVAGCGGAGESVEPADMPSDPPAVPGVQPPAQTGTQRPDRAALQSPAQTGLQPPEPSGFSPDQTAFLTALMNWVNERIGHLETQVTNLDRKVANLDAKIANLDAKVTSLDDRIDALATTVERRANENIRWTVGTGIALAGVLIAVNGLFLAVMMWLMDRRHTTENRR